MESTTRKEAIMPKSRSALGYLARKGLVDATPRPAPRLDVAALLVHTMPLSSPPQPSRNVLQQFEGDPSPDRIGTRPWPQIERSEE